MPISVTQVVPSQQEKAGKAFLDYVKRFTVNFSDFDATNAYRIPLEAGETVLGVRLQVESVFDAVTLTVGDSSDPDGFVKTAVLDPAVAGAFVNSNLVAAANLGAFGTGKHYTANDYLVVTLSGPSTKGELTLNVLFDGYGTGPGRDEIKNL